MSEVQGYGTALSHKDKSAEIQSNHSKRLWLALMTNNQKEEEEKVNWIEFCWKGKNGSSGSIIIAALDGQKAKDSVCPVAK